MHRKPHSKGFTLIELMVVISIIVVLITIVALGIPVVMNMVHEAETDSKLGNLVSLLSKFEYTLPDGSEINGSTVDDVNNSRFFEDLEEKNAGIKKDSLEDGWGNPIMYDRIWVKNAEIEEATEEDEEYDPDAEDEEEIEEGSEYKYLQINEKLPGHPVLRKCREEKWVWSEEMLDGDDMQREFIKYLYVIWSLGEKIYLDDDADEYELAGEEYFSDDDMIRWGTRGNN